VLRVEDNGPGIEAPHRERVFERFLPRAGQRPERSGLGLAIVAEVAKRHGAEIRLEPGINGVGTRISIIFSQ